MDARMIFPFRKKPDPFPDSIAVSGRTLTLSVRRVKGGRRFTLRLDRSGGGVTIGMPARAAAEEALKFLEAHRGWIAARIDALPPRRDLTPGSVVPFQGQELPIRHDPARPRAAALVNGALIVGGPELLVPGRVKRFLIGEARKRLETRIAALSAGLPGKPLGFAVRDTKSRWGSCSAAGRLNFSWRLILAPDFVLDYVVAHELAHLEIFRHGPAFDAAVDRIVPHRAAARAWLKKNGAALHRVG